MGANKVLELFGVYTRGQAPFDWKRLVGGQTCPFTNTKCFKVRKSRPDISIGTCTVRYGRDEKDVIICPNRLLERKQVFFDCLQLLTQHEPGNEFHVLPEVSIPGGSIDYVLASVRKGKVKDFVGVEFQTLDSTGTIWPERQRLLKDKGIKVARADTSSGKGFGMNWKMTAKTILVQLHHKIQTFEHCGKHLALVIQDYLLDYMRSEFCFDHLESARIGDPMHIHAYKLQESGGGLRLELHERASTDSVGIAKCLGLQAEAKVELETIVRELEKKVSAATLLSIDAPIPPVDGVLPTE